MIVFFAIVGLFNWLAKVNFREFKIENTCQKSQTDIPTDKQIDRGMDGRTDRQTGEQADRQMQRWTAGQMDRQTSG